MKFALEPKGRKPCKLTLSLICFLSLVSLALLAFFSLFEITKLTGVYDGMGWYTLPLNQIVTEQTDTHFGYYPTELLSVDPNEGIAVIRIQFPGQDWRQFIGRQGEHFGESGLFFKSLTADSITVTWGICGPVYSKEYHLRFRW